MSRTADGEACPACEAEYDRRLVVERGDRWADLFPGPPLSTLGRVRRLCTHRYDAERGVELPADRRAVYVHGEPTRTSVF